MEIVWVIGYRRVPEPPARMIPFRGGGFRSGALEKPADSLMDMSTHQISAIESLTATTVLLADPSAIVTIDHVPRPFLIF